MNIQEEIKKLEESIQKAEAVKASLLGKLKQEQEPEGNEFFAIPKAGDEASVVCMDACFGGFDSEKIIVREYETWTPCPTTNEYAEAFAEALNIWKEWNACKGVVAVDDESVQWYCSSGFLADYWQSMDLKNCFLSPIFDTPENCEASIKKIGVDKIRRLRNLLHFKLD